MRGSIEWLRTYTLPVRHNVSQFLEPLNNFMSVENLVHNRATVMSVYPAVGPFHFKLLTYAHSLARLWVQLLTQLFTYLLTERNRTPSVINNISARSSKPVTEGEGLSLIFVYQTRIILNLAIRQIILETYYVSTVCSLQALKFAQTFNLLKWRKHFKTKNSKKL